MKRPTADRKALLRELGFNRVSGRAGSEPERCGGG
jgi:hypothetical protein